VLDRRSVTTAGWALSLAEESTMSLVAGVRQEYQSDVGDSAEASLWRRVWPLFGAWGHRAEEGTDLSCRDAR
jgi:hypothetical protein